MGRMRPIFMACCAYALLSDARRPAAPAARMTVLRSIVFPPMRLSEPYFQSRAEALEVGSWARARHPVSMIFVVWCLDDCTPWRHALIRGWMRTEPGMR